MPSYHTRSKTLEANSVRGVRGLTPHRFYNRSKKKLRGGKKHATVDFVMAKSCIITDKSSKVVGGYSNRVRATKFNPTGKRRVSANIQRKKIFVPELDKTVTVNISTTGLRTLKKKGAYKALKDAGAL